MMTQTTDIHAAIRAADDSFEATFGRGDAAGMADLYTDDGMLLPTGSDFVQGKQAIEAFWQGAMDMGIESAARNRRTGRTGGCGGRDREIRPGG